MKAGIISAGFNLRLSSVGKPKGLVEINGKTIIENKIDYLQKAGFHEIYFVIREKSHELDIYLNKIKKNYLINLKIIKYNSVSPLDSTFALGKYLKKGEGILVFNVDAIFEYKDLEKFSLEIKKAKKNKDTDMIMWASPILKGINEDPAYIKFDDNLMVTEYGKSINPTNYVFGQIRYCSNKILNLCNNMNNNKDYKMNSFIKYLIQSKYAVSVFKTAGYTYDIDTPEDLNNVKKLTNDRRL